MAGKYAAPSTIVDALDRAWRTFYVNILLDAFAAIGGGALILIETGDLTSPLFWGALGLLLLKSILTSTASYILRLNKAPKQDSPSVTVLAPEAPSVTTVTVESAPEVAPVVSAEPKPEEQVTFVG